MALYGLYLTAFVRASISSASELAAQSLAMAEDHENNEFTAESLYLLGHSQMIAGKFDRAAECLDRAISLFGVIPKATTGLGSRQNRNCTEAYCISACNSWYLGFPNRAAKQMNEGLAVARSLNSKVIEEPVNNYASFFFFLLLRERERMRDHAVALVALVTESGNRPLGALGEFYLGWLDSVEGDRPKAIDRMRRALADLRTAGSLVTMAILLSSIAQSQGRLGRYSEAFVAIDEALTLIEETGDRAFGAEVHRIKGELLLAQNSSVAVQAEASFRTAIDIASRQNAKSWQLRATTSLARLLRDTGRRDEARTTLADIYNWFTEGFDTLDLKEAKALLDELSRPS